MRSAMLYVLGAACLVGIVSIAWWSREFMPPPVTTAATQGVYTVQPGDDLQSVAAAFDVPPESLVQANPSIQSTTDSLTPGEEITIPPADPSLTEIWGIHLVGIGAEILGVFLSFWLAIATGILPKTRVRRQVLGISLVLGFVSYAATMAILPNPTLSPQFVFMAVKDGFVWAAAFPMFARALGIRELPPPEPLAPAEPDPPVEPPAGGASAAAPSSESSPGAR